MYTSLRLGGLCLIVLVYSLPYGIGIPNCWGSGCQSLFFFFSPANSVVLCHYAIATGVFFRICLRHPWCDAKWFANLIKLTSSMLIWLFLVISALGLFLERMVIKLL